MADEYTFEETSFNVPTILVQGTNQIVWQTEKQPSESFPTITATTLSQSYMSPTPSENTLSETYMTASEGDASQYLSVLETSSETMLNNISHIENESFAYDQETEAAIPISDEVVIFRVDGSDDLYGLQVAEDEEGNLQRYQFQVIQNEEGQFETVAGTIQIMATEDEILPMAIPSEIPELSSHDSEPDENDEPYTADAHTEKVFVKQELEAEDMLDEEANTPEDQLQVDEEHCQEEEENIYDAEIDIDEIDTKDGIIANKEKKLLQIHKQEQIDYDYDVPETNSEIENSSITEEPDEEMVHDAQEANCNSPYEHIYIAQDEQPELEMHEEEQNNKEVDENSHSNVEHITTDVDISGITELIEEDQENLNNEDYINSDFDNPNVDDNGSDSEYEIDGAHITGEEENVHYHDEEDSSEPQDTKAIIRSNITNILSKAVKENMLKNSKSTEKNSYYLLKYTEKENVETDIRTNVIIPKTNSRSILKSTHKVMLEEKQPIIEKRFMKGKEASQVRKYQNMISQTTIIHAPIRQERLPRKQKIKPLERLGEEIVVQEVFVSSNGYIETREDGVLKNRKPLVPSDFIQLSDSEDDRKKKRKRRPKRRKSLIVISDSEDEVREQVNHILASPPKKQRGRKPKPKSLENPAKIVVSKSATELKKMENQCTKCPKSFPSIGSLRTHMQYHNFEVSKKLETEKEQLSKLSKEAKVETTKHQCVECQDIFKNNILLSKHMDLHKNPHRQECPVCRKIFTDRTQLLSHKRGHVKDKMFKSTTSLKTSPKKSKSPIKRQNTTKKIDICKCTDCGKTFSTSILLKTHSKSHKHFTCTNCSLNFLSKMLLDNHIRDDCVKPKVQSKIAIPSKSRISYIPRNSINTRVSYVPRKSINRSLSKRITRNSMNLSQPSKLKTTALNIKVKCDSCELFFNTHTKLFRHKVIEHNLETPDKSIRNETARKSLYKPIPEHSGIMPNERLKKTFEKLRNILEHQDSENK